MAAGAALLLSAASTATADDIVPPERIELGFGRTAEYDYDPPAPGSYLLPQLKQAPDGRVLTADGHSRSLRAVMSGRITLLSFIYTRCADPRGCPLATGLLYDVHYVSEQDPVIGDNVRLISLSFDPDYDTLETMAQYGAGAKAASARAADWQFLTTRSRAELEPILAAYGQLVALKADTADPFGPFYHQLRLFLIDREGWIRNIYSLGFLDPRLVVTDIRTLLLEERDRRDDR